jgi:hypothetical protein
MDEFARLVRTQVNTDEIDQFIADRCVMLLDTRQLTMRGWTHELESWRVFVASRHRSCVGWRPQRQTVTGSSWNWMTMQRSI